MRFYLYLFEASLGQSILNGLDGMEGSRRRINEMDEIIRSRFGVSHSGYIQRSFGHSAQSGQHAKDGLQGIN